MSGDGAAIRGARFNPKGVPALYLGLSIMTAVKEANQGFAHRIDPCVLCSYEIDCEDVADLTTEQERREFSVSGRRLLRTATSQRHGLYMTVSKLGMELVFSCPASRRVPKRKI